jgi:AmmeMemoRadiSam system protein B
MRRSPAVAGSFYPGEPQALTRVVERCLGGAPRPQKAFGAIVPHAGLQYSGPVAGAVYGRLAFPPTVILLGPNHYGRGSPIALFAEGVWETPLGDVEVDAELAGELRGACGAIADDPGAHRSEHSLEVQLPFLRRLAPTLRFVPLLLSVGGYQPLEELGSALAGLLAQREPRPMLLASSDFNHYESDRITRVKDRKAIDAILALDARGLYDVVRRERITMCGVEAAVVVLTAARALGVKRAEEVRYATSAEASGDYERVVGYAGILLH